MKTNLTVECRDKLINALKTHLNTKDKAIMFLTMTFKGMLPVIDITDSSLNSAINIYTEFNKVGMISNLIQTLNSIFDTKLTFET